MRLKLKELKKEYKWPPMSRPHLCQALPQSGKLLLFGDVGRARNVVCRHQGLLLKISRPLLRLSSTPLAALLALQLGTTLQQRVTLGVGLSILSVDLCHHRLQSERCVKGAVRNVKRGGEGV